jgi:hypothetical protein
MEDDLNFKADYLTTKTSKTNGFDTIEIDLVTKYLHQREYNVMSVPRWEKLSKREGLK